MAGSILSTPQAVETSVFVVRAFVRLKVIGHDADLRAVLAALRAIIDPPKKTGRPIGFRGK